VCVARGGDPIYGITLNPDGTLAEWKTLPAVRPGLDGDFKLVSGWVLEGTRCWVCRAVGDIETQSLVAQTNLVND
jgi:hypothetical protein